MSDATPAREPSATTRASGSEAKADAKMPDQSKSDTNPSPKVEEDPILALMQRLQRASALLGDRDAGLTRGIERLAEQAAEPGRTGQALFRTQVAYVVQDIEKIAGAGAVTMPEELRDEMTRLAATSPGLRNPQMEALVRSTPDIESGGLVRDIRRAAAAVSGLGDRQNSPAVKEQVDALENRVRLESRVMAPSEGVTVRADQPESITPSRTPGATTQRAPGAERPPMAQEPTAPPEPQARPETTTARSEPQTRTAASPGQGPDAGTPPQKDKENIDLAVSRNPQEQRAQQSRGLASGILNSMRSARSPSQAPWATAPVAMGERVSGFERAISEGKTEHLIRATEKSGVAYMNAIETFTAGPGAGVLGKVKAAASGDVGGVAAVMGEMREGGRHANLRAEFDTALQEDRVFAAAYSQIEKTGAQYGRDRLALEGDFEAKRHDPKHLDARFQKADEAIGEATSRIPGRAPGTSAMDELGEKLAEILSRAVERVRAVFGREAETQRASPSPGMSP